MLRRLFTLAAAVSLLLCVAACVLWVRSYWVTDEIRHRAGRATGSQPAWSITVTIINSSRGRVCALVFPDYARSQALPRVSLGWDCRTPADPSTDRTTVLDRLGFRWLELTDGRTVVAARGATIPHAALAAAMATGPVVWFRRHLRRRRTARPGLCVTCGYDLRATPDRCPECGRAAGRARGT